MRNPIRSGWTCAVLVLAALSAQKPVHAQAFYSMYYFMGSDGSTPLGDLLFNGGTIYGTTLGGGDNNAGAVFAYDTASGNESVLHSFQGGPEDGAAPIGGLVRDSAGNLYGTTSGGGAFWFGTVFEITAGGDPVLLHSFQGRPAEGSGPSGTLVRDRAGNLYGTTYGGGVSKLLGSVFEVTSGEATFIGAQNFPYGTLPRAGLLLEGGHLYGTSTGGQVAPPTGTVFEVGVAKPLYSFTGGTDGSEPMAGLIGDGHGNLYGAACTGGSGGFGFGNGVIFRLNLSTLQETPVHTFRGSDGTCPTSTLAADAQGNLYGTTMSGGAYHSGTVFKLNTSGLTVLHQFTGGTDGANPVAGVVLDSDGNLWGVASAGGFGYGLIFEIDLAVK